MLNWEAHPYRNSLSALALIAMRSVGADGYAFFEKVRETGALRRLMACGTPIPESQVLWVSGGPLAFPLPPRDGANGLLAFAFSTPSKLAAARTRLPGMVATIARLWNGSGAVGNYLSLLERIVALEHRLVDSKIADRAQGALRSGVFEPGAIERYVERILERSSETRSVLEKLLAELEEEVEERRVATVAKGILQATAGMTEEEAHAHLRMVSRRTRKRLKEAASEVIEKRFSVPSSLDPSTAVRGSKNQ